MGCSSALKALFCLSLWCGMLKGFVVLAEVDQRGRSQPRAKEDLPLSASLSAGLSGARRLASVSQLTNNHQAAVKGNAGQLVASSTGRGVAVGADTFASYAQSLVNKPGEVPRERKQGTASAAAAGLMTQALAADGSGNTRQYYVEAGAPAWPRDHPSMAVVSPMSLLQQVAQHATGGRFFAPHGVYSATTQQTPPCNQGQVSQIKCWLDDDGYITGLALEDEVGITAPALCRAEAEQQTDGGALDEWEIIVEVISCRGPGGAITYMEFHTNGTNNQPITCGRASRNKSGTNSAYGGSPVEECESLSQAQLAGEDHLLQTYLRTGSDVYSAEVYPVMGLRAGCNAQQQLVNISNRCWPGTGSSKATGPLLVEGRLRLRDGPSQAADSPYPAVACDKAVCQDQSFNQQVTEWLGAAVRDLLKELGISTDAPVQHAITSCKPCNHLSGSVMHFAVEVDLEDIAGQQGQQGTQQQVQALLNTNLCGRAGLEAACSKMGLTSMSFVDARRYGRRDPTTAQASADLVS